MIKADGLPSAKVNFDLLGPPPNLPEFRTISHSGNTATIDFFGGILQSANEVIGPWSDLTNAISPTNVTVTVKPRQFYRLHQ